MKTLLLNEGNTLLLFKQSTNQWILLAIDNFFLSTVFNTTLFYPIENTHFASCSRIVSSSVSAIIALLARFHRRSERCQNGV